MTGPPCPFPDGFLTGSAPAGVVGRPDGYW